MVSSLKFKAKSGFTLVELLVVLGILAVTVGVVLVFLTAVLKGTNQANITSELKQNGQVVLDSLERQIRNAKSVTTGPAIGGWIGGSTSHVILTLADNREMHLGCFNPPGTNTENGWIGVGRAPGTVVGDYTAATNRDLVAGVNVSSCVITVTNSSSSAPALVTLTFNLGQGIQAPSRKDYKASLEFKTTISLRKY